MEKIHFLNTKGIIRESLESIFTKIPAFKELADEEQQKIELLTKQLNKKILDDIEKYLEQRDEERYQMLDN